VTLHVPRIDAFASVVAHAAVRVDMRSPLVLDRGGLWLLSNGDRRRLRAALDGHDDNRHDRVLTESVGVALERCAPSWEPEWAGELLSVAVREIYSAAAYLFAVRAWERRLLLVTGMSQVSEESHQVPLLLFLEQRNTIDYDVD
jgi:hypothetical protein